jgi:hypothetical protein
LPNPFRGKHNLLWFGTSIKEHQRRGPDASTEKFMIEAGLRSVSFGMTAAELEFDDAPLILIDSNQMIGATDNGYFGRPIRFTQCRVKIAFLLEQRIGADPTLLPSIVFEQTMIHGLRKQPAKPGCK